MMSRMTISQAESMTTTLVPNYFIDEYMKDANDAQIKVYLFLLRLLATNKDTSISDIADEFNYTEKDIMRAISYWEKKQLIRVSYHENGDINSLCFLTPQSSAPASIPSAPIVSLVKPLTKETKTVQAELPAAPIMPSSAVEKNDYSLDDLNTMKESSAFGQILSIAEVYLGRSLSMSDIQSLAFIYDTLAFSFELIDYLIEYCVGKGKKEFSYIETVARNWHTNHITTVNQAKNYNYQYNKNVYLIMKSLGRRTDPTPIEAEYVKRWYDTFGFDEDVILEACERTVRKTDRNRFAYADRILTTWYHAGVHHLADIAKQDEAFSKTKSEKASSVKKSRDSFNNYTQRKYDYDALEKELTGNV